MSANKFKKRYVSYKPSVITYLDILGFRRLVGQKTAGNISRILRIMKETVAPGKSLSEAFEFRVQHFSDLAVRVLTVEGKYGEVYSELLNLVHMQVELLFRDVLVRGALTFGEIEKSWGLLYGPGLIRAYELEQAAIFPRILVDSQMLSQLKKNPMLRNQMHDVKTEMWFIRKLIRRDSDGYYFVDYLRAISSEFDHPVQYINFLKHHKQLIITGLQTFKSDKRTFEKYKWLKRYHNLTIEKHIRSKFRKGLTISKMRHS
jgi:hypothetical protein